MQNRVACNTCPPATFRTRHEAIFIRETILTVVAARHPAALQMAAIEAGLQSKMVVSGVVKLALDCLNSMPEVTFGTSLRLQSL